MDGLFAIHILDGAVLQPAWLWGSFALAAVLVALGSWRIDEEEIPRIAVMSSAFFMATLIRLPAVGGSSVHLLLNGLVGVVLGLRAALAIPLGVFLHAFLLGHGTLWTIGINSCVMDMPALAAWLVFGRLRRDRWLERPRLLWTVGFLLGSLTVLATAALNYLTLAFGGVGDWPRLAEAAFLIHLPVAALEGLIMATTVGFLARVKPEMLGLQTLRPHAEQEKAKAAERQAG